MTGTPEFWQVVQSRRSVRQFTPQPVDKTLIEQVLETGTQAPNAHNRQSWRFAVLTEKADMVRMAEAMGADYRQALAASGMPAAEVEERARKRVERLSGAPVVVVLCVDTADLDGYSDAHRDSGEYLMAVQSAALGGGHMLLAAQALGLAGVWLCAPLFAPEKVRKALNLPETWRSQGMLLLGYPADAPAKRERKPLETVVRWVGKEAA
ncbi:nitroreductase family protein [bacterium]|nr:nitroreductase family protein [bacterium]MCB2179391.1 nitroreductase family protein [bacterium]